MGTVGLSFGSATSGAGFDVSSTVNSILAIERGIENPWKTQLAHLQAQDVALTKLGTDLSTLTTKLQALTDFDGVLAEKEGSSSNTDALALTSATAVASAGNHDIVIRSLAQTSSVYSGSVSSTDTLSGSVTVQVGSGSSRTVTLSGSDNSLAGLQKAINLAGIGVRASILTDSTGSRLSLVSTTSGASGQLTVASNLTDASTSTALSFSTGHVGVDAALTVDGVDITSSSNSVSNAIPGVTFQLLNTTSTAVQVEITNNVSAVSAAVSDFVTAYNAIVADLKAQEGKDSSGASQPLYGDPTLALLQTQLSSALLNGTASGSVRSVAQLGITLNQNGTLTFSQSAFASAYGANPIDITGFLQDLDGFGSHFHSVLSGLGTESYVGALHLAQSQNAAQEKTLSDSISNEEARIAVEKVRLTKELNLANEILQAIPSQLREIDQIYSALTGYNTK